MRDPSGVPGGARLKEAALDLLALPLAVLLLVGAGDVLAGGDPHGASHILHGLSFIPVLLLAWRFPRAMGTVLVMGGAAGCTAFLATIALPPAVAIATGVAAFAPPIIAGLLLRGAAASPAAPAAPAASVHRGAAVVDPPRGAARLPALARVVRSR